MPHALARTHVSVRRTAPSRVAGRRRTGGASRLRLAGRRGRLAVAGALRRLERGFAEPLSVPALAREAGLSPGYFSQVFREATGRPPYDFVVERRIARARELLAEGGKPAEVAAETGFADQSHLTREFRRRTGETPAAFARRARRKQPSGREQS